MTTVEQWNMSTLPPRRLPQVADYDDDGHCQHGPILLLYPLSCVRTHTPTLTSPWCPGGKFIFALGFMSLLANLFSAQQRVHGV